MADKMIDLYFKNPVTLVLVFLGTVPEWEAKEILADNRLVRMSAAQYLPDLFQKDVVAKAELNAVLKETFSASGKIEAIKRLRRFTAMGLLESKNYIEEVCG